MDSFEGVVFTASSTSLRDASIQLLHDRLSTNLTFRRIRETDRRAKATFRGGGEIIVFEICELGKCGKCICSSIPRGI